MTPATAVPVTGQPTRLLRLFGVVFGLAVILGNTIGAGILRTPGQVADYLPSAVLFQKKPLKRFLFLNMMPKSARIGIVERRLHHNGDHSDDE